MIELYLTFSILIGLILILDGILLLKENGQFGANKILSITTSVEFLWAMVSIYILFKYTFPIWSILVPLLFVIHNVLGWFYGAYLLNKIDERLKEPSQLSVPLWYVKFGLTFGIVFSCFSLITLLRINS